MGETISNETPTGNKRDVAEKRIRRRHLHKKSNIDIIKNKNKLELLKKSSKVGKILSKKVKK